MEHSFKFMYIIAIVVVILLILSMGMYIMAKTDNLMDDFNLNKADVSEFNAQWLIYNNIQKGSAIRGMFKKLAKNAIDNADVPYKLIDVAYNTSAGSDFTVINSTVAEPNSDAFNKAMAQMDVSHSYIVECIYNEKNGIITGMIIKNNRNDEFKFTPMER